jgi:hypothetical protein
MVHRLLCQEPETNLTLMITIMNDMAQEEERDYYCGWMDGRGRTSGLCGWYSRRDLACSARTRRVCGWFAALIRRGLLQNR